jgi:amino acid transporter
VASAWTKYFNILLESLGLPAVPAALSNDPFADEVQGIFNLPSVVIMGLVTVVLVLGIRESARTNAILVLAKLAVVLFVIVAGWSYVNPANWTQVPVARRAFPQEKKLIPGLVKDYLKAHDAYSKERALALSRQLSAQYRIFREERETARLEQEGKLSEVDGRAQLDDLRTHVAGVLAKDPADQAVVAQLLPQIEAKGREAEAESWGILAYLGLNEWLIPIDDATRSPFMPYGFSGIMLGASIVFFAFIGFDSISTHAEEARRPQRDVPIGILISLSLCTLLYILVAAVVTGMVPYTQIDIGAPIADAFAQKASAAGPLLRMYAAVIAVGGLAGMTSVLLVLFLSQARIFMAMARDGLLPEVFGTVHPRFRTPHVATILTGTVICAAAALTPIYKLEEMVNVGTLMAFVMVCGAVVVLRFQRPDVARPFRCPILLVVGPLGIVLNLALMLFLPLDTWGRLVIWLLLGFVIYFGYSRRHSHLVRHLLHEIQAPRDEAADAT